MKTKLLSLLLITTIAISSCKKDNAKLDTTNDIDKLNPPSGFNFQASRDVEFSIGISDNRFQNMIHVISVYSDDPAKGGELLSSGSATLISPFNTKIYLPGGANSVFIRKTSPDGSTVNKTVTFSGTKSSIAIGATDIVTSSVASASSLQRLGAAPMNVPTETSPDCNTGVDEFITQSRTFNSGNWQAKNYAVSANNVTITLGGGSGGTLRVCGTGVSIQVNDMPANFTLIVTSTGSVNFTGNMNWNNNTALIKNFGTVTFPGGLKPKDITNYKTLTFNGGLETDAGTIRNAASGTVVINGNPKINGSIDNDGSFTFTGSDVTFNSGNNTITNNGTMEALNAQVTVNSSVTLSNNKSFTAKKILSNGSSTINNRCKMTVVENFHINGTVNNYSFIDSKLNTYINSSGKINLYDGAFFKNKNLELMDGIVTGSNSGSTIKTSLFKVTGTSDNRVFVNSSGYFTGTVQYADATRLLSQNGKLRNGATSVIGDGIYIAKDDCNDGNFKDRDGDGVADDLDNYPDDVTKAFDHYSGNYANGGSTVAFEDSWPLEGDYDLNDVVITYKYHLVSNAANKVVQVKADYKLIATGGTFQNGTGIQFNLPAGSAKNFASATGASLESGQDSVVVLLFSNSREQQATWNTVVGQSVSPVKDFSISFDVENGPLVSSFGVGNYNPFIWNSSPGFGRGYETHLSGKRPTKKMNVTLFRTGDDRSDANGIGKSYATANNLPWAIQVPVANFKYPIEKTPITDAYKMFSTWATSAGVQKTDWYSNTSNLYRDAAKLY